MTHPMKRPPSVVKASNTMIPMDNPETDPTAPVICGPAISGPAISGLAISGMELIVLAAAVAHFGRGLGEQVLVALSWVVLNRHAQEHAFELTNATAGANGWAESLLADPVERETARALAVFTRVVAGSVDDPTDGATRFHCHDETPTWAEGMDIRAIIGPYLFYAPDPRISTNSVKLSANRTVCFSV